MWTFVLALLWGQQASPPPPPPKEPVYKFYSTVFGTDVYKSGGLIGLVYALEPDTPRLPLFDGMRPISKVYTTSLNIPVTQFDKGFPGVPERFEWFAIDYTGRIWIPKTGTYRFTLESDDGSALFVDNRVIIDNDGIHPMQRKKGSVHLKPGPHEIRVAYFQGPRFQIGLRLMVASPGQGLRVLRMEEFGPPREQ